jgi:hypothetical protein
MLEDIKGASTFCKSKDIQYNGQKIKDTKGVIKTHKSKKDRQHNEQRKEDKSTNNYLKPLRRKIRTVFEDVNGGNQDP